MVFFSPFASSRVGEKVGSLKTERNRRVKFSLVGRAFGNTEEQEN
jgi:hypothetical protein